MEGPNPFNHAHPKEQVIFCDHYWFLEHAEHSLRVSSIPDDKINVCVKRNFCQLCYTELHEPPLMIEVRRGNVEGVRELLNRGANPNRPSRLIDTCAERFNPHEFTVLSRPLHEAFKCKQLVIALLLLNNGASMDILDGFEKTPLHWFNYDGSVHAELITLQLGLYPNVS